MFFEGAIAQLRSQPGEPSRTLPRIPLRRAHAMAFGRPDPPSLRRRPGPSIPFSPRPYSPPPLPPPAACCNPPSPPSSSTTHSYHTVPLSSPPSLLLVSQFVERPTQRTAGPGRPVRPIPARGARARTTTPPLPSPKLPPRNNSSAQPSSARRPPTPAQPSPSSPHGDRRSQPARVASALASPCANATAPPATLAPLPRPIRDRPRKIAAIPRTALQAFCHPPCPRLVLLLPCAGRANVIAISVEGVPAHVCRRATASSGMFSHRPPNGRNRLRGEEWRVAWKTAQGSRVARKVPHRDSHPAWLLSPHRRRSRASQALQADAAVPRARQ